VKRFLSSKTWLTTGISVENMPTPKPLTNEQSIPEVAPTETPRPVAVERRQTPAAKFTVVNRTVERAKDLLFDARRFFRDTAEHRPLQLILALGATAFVAGAMLRIWRSNRYARKQLFYKWRA
jgi:hypothetical protein